MYSTLPREVLKQIFADSNITNKDLGRLQFTCKQWGSVAQEHLYKTIKLPNWGADIDRSSINERLKLLIQTSLLLNNKSRNWVREVLFGSLFDTADFDGPDVDGFYVNDMAKDL